MSLERILSFITGQSQEVPSQVKGSPRLSGFESLNIYRNDYFCRLQNVLGEHYPMTWKILGDEQFYHLAKDYLLKNPSQSWDINSYGHCFPQYLEANSPSAVTEHFPFIPDLAHLEWANHVFFHEDGEPSPVTDLPTTEDKIGRLQLSDKLLLFTSVYQIPSIYRAAQNNESQRPIDWNQPSFYFLSKKDFQVQLEDLNEAQFRLLTLWKKHGSFQNMTEAIDASISDDDPLLAEIAPTIERLIDRRLVCCA